MLIGWYSLLLALPWFAYAYVVNYADTHTHNTHTHTRMQCGATHACFKWEPCGEETHTTHTTRTYRVVMIQRGATHARFKWEPCGEENGSAVSQYCLELNGPLADDFSPIGDLPKWVWLCVKRWSEWCVWLLRCVHG